MTSSPFIQAKMDRDQPLGVYHIFHMVEALFQKSIYNSYYTRWSG